MSGRPGLLSSQVAAEHSSHPTLCIMGSTGSIGRQALQFCAEHPHYNVTALIAGGNAELLIAQALQHRPSLVAVADPQAYIKVRDALRPHGITVSNDVHEAAAVPHDRVLAAISGVAGVLPSLAALAHSQVVALANKETIVYAGDLIRVRRDLYRAAIVPVDSEHAALFALFDFDNPSHQRRLILPASGGPFLHRPLASMADVTPTEAAAHPRWSMGTKISIDSALLINKVLEIIEAYVFFGLTPSHYDIIIHPEAIIHAAIERTDGSLLLHAAPPDMLGPIAGALLYPSPAPRVTPTPFALLQKVNFIEPDPERFPVLQLLQALLAGDSREHAVFALAAEQAVQAFVAGKIRFTAIVPRIEAMAATAPRYEAVNSAEDLMQMVACETQRFGL